MSLLLGLSSKTSWSPKTRFYLQPVGVGHYVGYDDTGEESLNKNNDFTHTDLSEHRQSDHTFHNQTPHAKQDGTENLIPLPDWPVALKRWGLCWDFHIYGFAVLFLALTLINSVIFFRFRLRVQRFKIVFNTLILLATAAIFRAVFMLIDPYGYKGRMAGLMVGIMTQAVYPLFCACYGLTQVMLLRMTNVDVGRSRLRTLSCLLGCTLSYLFLVVVIETLVFYERSLKLLLLLDSGCFIVWSLCLGVTFICSGFRLTQYATETKRARKELNAFSNHRRSTSNTTGLSAISSTTNDTNINVISVDLTPTSSEFLPVTTTTPSDTVVADTPMSPTSPAFPFLPQGPSAPRINQAVRLSRPRLKISDRNHMMITIATDDDDESTSSTDVDKPVLGTSEKQGNRSKKRSKSKQTRFRSRSQSRTPTPCALSPVNRIDKTIRTRKSSSVPRKRHKSSSNGSKSKEVTASCSNTSLSERPNTSELQSSPSKTKNSGVVKAKTTASELPLLTSSLLNPQQSLAEQEDDKSQAGDADDDDDDDDDDNGNIYKDMSHLTAYCRNGDRSQTELEKGQQPQTLSFGMGIDLEFNRSNSQNFIPFSSQSVQTNEHPYEALSRIDSTPFSTPIDMDPVSSSPRENGYLADTENILSCSSFSRLSSTVRQPLAREEPGHLSCDVSSQRTSCSQSDEESTTTSPAVSDRMMPNMPAPLGLFRIRQSKVVQRAVHLTYFLTFLFMFACLLQLYTVFGVYGVLGTIPRPDPWPWLIFHTIFRATEVSIGFTTATIAFITLNHRHQRAKRRHQQQQHLEATRDCIV